MLSGLEGLECPPCPPCPFCPSLSLLHWPRLGAPSRQHVVWAHLESPNQLCQNKQKGQRAALIVPVPTLLPEQGSVLPRLKWGWG